MSFSYYPFPEKNAINLNEIEDASVQIQITGARYTEAMENLQDYKN